MLSAKKRNRLGGDQPTNAKQQPHPNNPKAFRQRISVPGSYWDEPIMLPSQPPCCLGESRVHESSLRQ